MVNIIDKEVLSSDQQHMLKGKVYYPEGEARGLLQVVHGMTEYVGRYDGFMREMAEYGYIVFGYDQLGHGMTAKDESELGFFAHEDGWKRLIEDVYLFGSAVRKEEGEDLPFILMGHSMGSFIVRLTAARYKYYDKLIVMGTAGPQAAASAGITLSELMIGLMGERHCSKLTYDLAFRAYNADFELEHDSRSWFTIKKEARYDPNCNFMFTLSAMQDLVRLAKYCNDDAWFHNINKEKPILLISGSEDPVGERGEGVRQVYERLTQDGANVQMILYEGYRHIILEDYCRNKVIRDIKKFIG